nr:MAG TPA: hypothetical protein [Caudoviricetes sp.]
MTICQFVMLSCKIVNKIDNLVKCHVKLLY